MKMWQFLSICFSWPVRSLSHILKQILTQIHPKNKKAKICIVSPSINSWQFTIRIWKPLAAIELIKAVCVHNEFSLVVTNFTNTQENDDQQWRKNVDDIMLGEEDFNTPKAQMVMSTCQKLYDVLWI